MQVRDRIILEEQFASGLERSLAKADLLLRLAGHKINREGVEYFWNTETSESIDLSDKYIFVNQF